MCCLCYKREFFIVKNPDTIFVHNGLYNSKKAHKRFKQHAQSSTHREAVVHVKKISLPTIDTQLSRQCHKSSDHAQEIDKSFNAISLVSVVPGLGSSRTY